ncbi:hypothetical protein CSKR_107513 [Clonorchis sinensis]|uniref:Uncharacterized protein n=1 Tax=Clonorchis sinensis TaxID=79923 RepID=A0A3R7FME7_CLOSI|nr:hypothetical protein CSKR_107513 [Clonorchis sinensis]
MCTNFRLWATRITQGYFYSKILLSLGLSASLNVPFSFESVVPLRNTLHTSTFIGLVVMTDEQAEERDKVINRIKLAPTIPPKWLVERSEETLVNLDYLTEVYKEARRLRYREEGRLSAAESGSNVKAAAPPFRERKSPYVTEQDKLVYRNPSEIVRSLEKPDQPVP